ncbi:MAG: SET domain-containing protein-lysine N-methyltransferase [Actinomycetota bacterium]|nr:SET domain-containing protein-lysine N-methyltransferase [Actinomycetota bacterium]
MNVIGYELRTTAGKGDGVFAVRHFAFGETVMVGVIQCQKVENHSHATQVGLWDYVQLGDLCSKVNHSCQPNCGVRLNNSGAPDLIAIEPIVAEDEITFDYAMRNYWIEHLPRCRCGAPVCRGFITGWKDLPTERKEAYRGFVAPYLLELDREMKANGSIWSIEIGTRPTGRHAPLRSS